MPAKPPSIAYLHTAQRHCPCGRVRAVARACARRFPGYARPTQFCDTCGIRVECPEAATAAFGHRPEPATPSPWSKAHATAGPYRWYDDPRSDVANEYDPICAECGRPEDDANDVRLIAVEVELPYPPHEDVWRWWCLACLEASDAQQFP